MTIGAQAIAASTAPRTGKLLVVSGVLAWSGLSVQAQVMSLVAGTPVRYWFYMKTRLLQIPITGLNTDRLFTVAGQPTPRWLLLPLPFVFINACGRRLLRASCQGIMWSTAVLLMICLISRLTASGFRGPFVKFL